MGRHRVLLGFTLSLILCLTAIPASAIEVIEVWRGESFGWPDCVSVNPTDGSCWVGADNTVFHLAQDGTELRRVGGFDLGSPHPLSVSVNPTDGSCWLADHWHDEVVVLAEDGAELLRVGGVFGPASAAVNPADSSCWVADMGNGEVVHLGQDGTELVRVGGFTYPGATSVNPTDGSCWVSEHGEGQVVAHLAEDGTVLWWGTSFNYPVCVSVNPIDGSCWVADMDNDQVVHLAQDGTELWRGGGFNYPRAVSVNPADGSCWVADGTREWGSMVGAVVHLAEDGTELWRGEDFWDPLGVSVNPTDGSCWVPDTGNGQVVHLAIPGWQPSIFYDVPWYFWAFDEVGACYEADIVGGYTPTRYRPTLPVSRDQMAVYISRALAGGDENVPDFTGTPTFPDVPGGFWALKYVEYAVSQNVVAGYLDGTYHPEYPVTRDQMAVYVARSICDPTGEDGLADYTPADPRNFPDVASDFWSYKHVEYCVENGVVAGYLDGLYHPEYVVTRDQMAVYVARAFGLLP
jgi:DNA-binding beta-propeller fold protein YncE